MTSHHVVDLILGTDSLTIEERRQEPTVTRGEDGHWFVAGLMLSYKWAEFDPSGRLVRAPGKRGQGPGEFTEILRVIPLRADTLLVIERTRAVRTLRDGKYIDQESLPFRVKTHTIHAGLHWVTGAPSRALFLWAFSPSGRVVHRYQLRGEPSYGAWHSGEVVSWEDKLWVWEAPRGPLLHVDTDSGRILDRFEPLQEENGEWRVTDVIQGPGATMILNFYDMSGSQSRREWVFLGGPESIVRRIAPPDHLRFSQLLSPGMASVGRFAASPFDDVLIGLGIYRLDLPAGGGPGPRPAR